MHAFAREFGRHVLDLLLPPNCLTCDRPVAVMGQLCAECFGRTEFITAPFCDACGVPFAHPGVTHPGAGGEIDRLCPACHAAPPPWMRARGALRYDAQAGRLLMALKYADRPDLAAPLAGIMARAGAELLRDAELIAPVPLHRRRLFTRRYNQSALLAAVLARRSGVPAALDLLRRVRATAPLGDLGAAARMAVLDGAIAVRQGRLARAIGRRVLLVDDVMTSGATAGACTTALLAAGAIAVDVLVAARVPDPRGG